MNSIYNIVYNIIVFIYRIFIEKPIIAIVNLIKITISLTIIGGVIVLFITHPISILIFLILFTL